MNESDLHDIGRALKVSYDWLIMIYRDSNDDGQIETTLNKQHLKSDLKKIVSAIDKVISNL
jgi:hypothetical protein